MNDYLWSEVFVRYGRIEAIKATSELATHFASSRILATSFSSNKSSLSVSGGEALLKPVPVTSHPAFLKAETIARPSKPVPPVTRAL
jgi:hypothetical protein